MKKLILILVMLFLFVITLNNVNAISGFMNLSATEDTYTDNDNLDTNYGNSIISRVMDRGSPYKYDSYLEYIINDIPDGQEINNASLCLYANFLHDVGQNVTIYLLNHFFVENTLDWNDDYRQYILYNYNVSYEFDNSDLDKYTCIDITNLVSYAYSQDEAFLDLILIGSNYAVDSLGFSSKEGVNPTYVTLNYSTDYSNLCQYNALKDGTITTCYDFSQSYHCQFAFDELIHTQKADPLKVSEWITDSNVGSAGGSIVAKVIINMDNAFLFDRVEVWQRSVLPEHIGAKEYDISVYSPETDTWYLLIDEDNTATKDGVSIYYGFGGSGEPGAKELIPYLKNIDTIYIGNLSISKVQMEIYETLIQSYDYTNFLAELAFCMVNVTNPEDAYFDYIALAEVGAGCDVNEDCECLLCEYGFCTLRTTNMDCIINGTSRDDCCLSGTCSNGKCTKTSMWDSIEASKKQQFGDDTKTNNFIALFFIIGIAGFLMYHGNVIAGIFALYMLSIFFVMIGWLSPFLLLGMVITGLIAVVFKIMTGHSTD